MIYARAAIAACFQLVCVCVKRQFKSYNARYTANSQRLNILSESSRSRFAILWRASLQVLRRGNYCFVRDAMQVFISFFFYGNF